MTVLLAEGGFAQKLTLDPYPKEGKGGNQMGESAPARGGMFITQGGDFLRAGFHAFSPLFGQGLQPSLSWVCLI